MGLHLHGKNVKHQICSIMAKLYLACATTSCLSSFLVYQVMQPFQDQQIIPLEKTAKLTPDDQGTTRATRDRLQDLPKWSEEFTEHLVEPRSIPSGSDSKDTPESLRPDPLLTDKPEGKHNLSTYFPGDPTCEICKRTKIDGAACRRNS